MRGAFKFKRWILVAVLAAILLIALLSLASRHPALSTSVTLTFVAYTNPPGSDLRFALFSVSNQAPYAIRWRGSWVEVEGRPEHKAETLNSSLPGFSREPVLKAGRALRVAVGEPFYDSEGMRWRYAMSFVRYTWGQRWLDFSMRHKLPLGVGSVALLDPQRLLSPSNNLTVTTVWFAK